LLLNAGFEAMGIYDDFAEIHISKSVSKEVILLPTHHLGTPQYYDDLHKKVDSLSALDYFFYVEKIQIGNANDTILRKFRKFSGGPVPSSGYKNIVDSILGKKYKIKLKKELIDQPSYLELGVPAEQSENVDATLDEVINYYEAEYGEIKLASCDFETKYIEETTCPKFKVSRETRNDVLENFRNKIVLKRIDIEKHNKIAIIYGDAHTPGLLEGLKERGYLLEE
tara:strand:+ start:8540 stop:9214 length:675 start_codon:yes stop_codon:yes gene_type:complete